MSGVNAHAILSTPQGDRSTDVTTVIWQRARFYALPKQFVISSIVRLAQDTVIFAADFKTPGLAALHDMHLYQAQCLHPAVLVEFATVATSYSLGDTAISMDPILECTVLGPALTWSSQLSCSLYRSSGDLTIFSDGNSQRLTSSAGTAVSQPGFTT